MRVCDLDEIKVCIDRQYENCHGYSGSKKAIYREAILAVKSILHSAKPIDGVTVQEWISVKDRLPEDQEEVLVCTRSKTELEISTRAIWLSTASYTEDAPKSPTGCRCPSRRKENDYETD